MTSIEKGKSLSGDVDAVRTDSNASQAGKDTENMEIGEVYCHPTAAEEKALLRKIDWRSVMQSRRSTRNLTDNLV